MAYTFYPAVAVSDLWTASDNNTYNRANINELWAYTTAGDMVYASSPTALSRIPVGSTGQVLTISGGVPVWSTGAPGIFEAESDLLYGTGANAMAILARGDNGNVLSLSSGIPAWEVVSSVEKIGTQAYHSTTNSIAVSATSVLSCDSENFDDDSWHSTTTNNSRITVSEAGRYMVFANVEFSEISSKTSTGLLYIYVNGSSVATKDMLALYNINIESLFLDLSASDYIEIAFYHISNGSSENILAQVKSFAVLKID